MAYFLNKFLMLYQNNIEKYKAAERSSISIQKSNLILTSAKELMRIQSNVCLSSITMIHNDFKPVIKEIVTNNVPKLDR